MIFRYSWMDGKSHGGGLGKSWLCWQLSLESFPNLFTFPFYCCVLFSSEFLAKRLKDEHLNKKNTKKTHLKPKQFYYFLKTQLRVVNFCFWGIPSSRKREKTGSFLAVTMFQSQKCYFFLLEDNNSFCCLLADPYQYPLCKAHPSIGFFFFFCREPAVIWLCREGRLVLVPVAWSYMQVSICF